MGSIVSHTISDSVIPAFTDGPGGEIRFSRSRERKVTLESLYSSTSDCIVSQLAVAGPFPVGRVRKSLVTETA